MANSGSSDDLFHRYLTRTLEEHERSAFAERLLTDPGFSDELAEFEAEWIDARARGELPPGEAAEVDAYLAATGSQHRLTIARRLLRQQRPAARRRVPMWLGLAAAAVLGLVVFRVSQPAAHSPAPTARPNAATPAATPAFTVLLVPGARSTGPRRVSIPPDISLVEFQLALDAPLAPGAYQATLQSAAGQTVHTAATSLVPGQTSLRFTLDATLLPPGSYAILLTPASAPEEPVNAYTFAVR